MTHARPPLALSSLVLAAVLAAGADWPTYRGNVQRTGNTDGLAGPASPRVLWVHRSQEHFIASPVPADGQLLLAGLGGFNVPTLYSFATDTTAPKRVLWSKSTPLLKLPIVSAPAVVGDRVVLGDGMHQTDGALLHCLRLPAGLPLWQLPVPGKLVHLEGAPTVAGGRVYVGGGAAGVVCLDPERLTLEGKEMDAASIQKLQDQKWKDLVARYEADRKKDPDFAVPPNEDQLPRPAPRRLWQQGEGKWHVDAPLAVVGDRVLVASAYLGKEQIGDLALYRLDAATGTIRWRAPLRVNPWGGPSVEGGVVVVGGSTIGYDPRSLKGARGDVVAFDLADGKEKWRKEVPGGVLSSVALAGGLAVATATDGKVRAFDLATGERRWVYEGKTPFFAAPAVVAGVVYAGDLLGGVHALGLADGVRRWKLDLGTHADVKAPGMIYGGPVVHGGRVFVATCNLAEGPFANQPTVVVCLGEK
jgi:outer membrane protein assembly factor BamB